MLFYANESFSRRLKTHVNKLLRGPNHKTRKERGVIRFLFSYNLFLNNINI